MNEVQMNLLILFSNKIVYSVRLFPSCIRVSKPYGAKMCEKIVRKSNRILQKWFDHKDSVVVHFVFNDDGTVTRVSAHKVVLAEGSPVFGRLFFGLWQESGDIPRLMFRLKHLQFIWKHFMESIKKYL